ncbi:AzlD domain-containing protein [Inquilinus sp.]|jgi:branched-subunit amino acid transport protein|uniref:AzlD domain-containing protein n=1 Tax=Inquilinus sp. TaxID=1932117 RepID=UPI003783A1B6
MAEALPWAMLLGAAAATYLWRALGVYLAGRVREGGALLDWVGCVAYAILAGLIARMILLPAGPLAVTSMAERAGATALGLAVFLLFRRNVLLGVGAGAGALMLMAGWA